MGVGYAFGDDRLPAVKRKSGDLLLLGVVLPPACDRLPAVERKPFGLRIWGVTPCGGIAFGYKAQTFGLLLEVRKRLSPEA